MAGRNDNESKIRSNVKTQNDLYQMLNKNKNLNLINILNFWKKK